VTFGCKKLIKVLVSENVFSWFNIVPCMSSIDCVARDWFLNFCIVSSYTNTWLGWRDDKEMSFSSDSV
jgi:hypothetical protein